MVWSIFSWWRNCENSSSEVPLHMQGWLLTKAWTKYEMPAPLKVSGSRGLGVLGVLRSGVLGPWIPWVVGVVGVLEGLWVLGVLGGPWRSLEVLGGPWRSLEVLGGPWRSLEVLGGPWRSLESLGALGSLEVPGVWGSWGDFVFPLGAFLCLFSLRFPLFFRFGALNQGPWFVILVFVSL